MFNTKQFYTALPIVITKMYMSDQDILHQSIVEHHINMLKLYTGNNTEPFNISEQEDLKNAIRFFYHKMQKYNIVIYTEKDENLVNSIHKQILSKKFKRWFSRNEVKPQSTIKYVSDPYYMTLEKLFLKDPTRFKLFKHKVLDGFMYNAPKYKKTGRYVIRYVGWKRELKDNGYYGIVFYYPENQFTTITV